MTYPQFEYSPKRRQEVAVAARLRRKRREELAAKGWVTVPNVPLPRPENNCADPSHSA